MSALLVVVAAPAASGSTNGRATLSDIPKSGGLAMSQMTRP